MEDDLKHTHVLAKGVALFVIFPLKRIFFFPPILLPHVRVLQVCFILSNIFYPMGVKGGLPFHFGQQTKMMSLPPFV